MKLVISSHSSDVAGAELSLLRIVETAVKSGHTGLVTVPREGPLIKLLEPHKKSFSVAVIPTRMWMGRRFSLPVGLIRLCQSFLDVFKFLPILKAGQFDVMIVNSAVIPAPLLAARISGLPCLLIVRESVLTNPLLRSALPRKTIRLLLAKMANKVVTVSKYVATQFVHESSVIYPQVSELFYDDSSVSVVKKRETGLRIVMLGTISEEKGQLDAVRAVSLVGAHHEDIALDIYGHGSESDVKNLLRCIDILALNDVVTVHSPTSRVLEVYRQADLSIVCSRNEAFGKVTAESIMAGTPVIGYNLGGTSEILALGGGILIEPNSLSLADAINRLWSDNGALSRLEGDCGISKIKSLLAETADKVLGEAENLVLVKQT